MRGRMQAIFVVAGAAALPMLFWLSAAAGSLVLLRRGLNDALSVLVWAVIPARHGGTSAIREPCWYCSVRWGWRSCCAVMRRGCE